MTKVSIFTVICTILLLAGCSTTNHAPLATMVYADITGHYNAYFNTKQKLIGVYQTLDKSHKDNYKDIISLYTYTNPKEAGGVTKDLEDIEKRETESVQLHKISNWTDDHFVQMGVANFIKGNYDRAASFFKYTTTEYKNGVDYVKEMKKLGKIAKPTMKKKAAKKPKFEEKLDDKGNLVLNKIDERPSYSPMIHAPARSKALIWLARTYSAQKKYTEASAVIQYARSDDKFYRNEDKYLELAEAENLLNQKDYRDAIKPLEKFLTMSKSKAEKLRPVFILAQINEKLGDNAKASYYYKEVLNNKPSYEMEFYAKIKRAKLSNKSGSTDEIKKLLLSMSHDGKYKDYLDQIYYELGMIVLAENNRTEARKDFHKSIASSLKNPEQKAASYLILAQMDYEEEYYVTSKFLYDSTVANMSKTDTAYDGVQARDKTLGKLVTQINIITAEDSLQRIANMSDADRARFLTRLIDQKQKDADAKQAAKSANTDFIKQGVPGVNNSGPGAEEASNFYFYNVASRSNGYSEFIKKWGNRKLEDNWRRKDKSATLTDNSDDADSSKLVKDTTATLGSEEQKLLAGLPMTPEKMEKSNGKIIDAYYALGSVYKDDLQSYHKAISAFEELNRRFPKNKLELESFYQLYLLYERTKNSNKSDVYKNAILTNYPNSTIAKYIQDPGYLAQLKKKENSLSSYYEEAYNDYSSGLYASAEKKCADVDAQFKENKLRAKFDILNAMALAKENRLGDYVQSLNKIISKYPGTPEKDQAQAWLNTLNHSKLPQIDISKLPKDSTGNVIGGPEAGAVTSIPINDTTGRAAFLAKMDAAKKDQAKLDAQADLVKSLAAARSAADSAKNAPQTAAAAPGGKPPHKLSITEKIDSQMRAERQGNKPTASTIPSKPAAATTPAATTPSPGAAATPAAPAPDSAAKPVAKDSTAKAPKPKPGVKPAVKPIAKDTAAKKPATIVPPAVKDTTPVKPAPKPVPAPALVAAKPALDADTTSQIYGKGDGPHYVIVYFLDASAYAYAINTKIDNFNGTSYAADRLNARSVILDKDNKLIVVKPFKDAATAKAYVTALTAKVNDIMPGIKPDQYFIGAISQINYPTLIDKKKINNYMHFYKANY